MILNKQFLNRVSNNSQYEIRKSINESFSHQKNYDIFISHSFLDKKLISALASLFEEDNLSVYIDWVQDPYLDRNHVTLKTAELVKDRIKQCKSLAYISTQNVTSSKWCPWELGVGDGIHNGKACILPILEENGENFKGQEYLGLYPYIDYASIKGYNTKHFWVTDPQNTNKYVLLKDWINGEDLKIYE